MTANCPTFTFGFSYGHQQAARFSKISDTAKVDSSLTVSLLVTSVRVKTIFGRSLLANKFLKFLPNWTTVKAKCH